MCGLFGYVGSAESLGWAREAVYEAAKRGPHAYGLAVWVDEGPEARTEHSLGPLMAQVDAVMEWIHDAARGAERVVVLGHARLATVGHGSRGKLADVQPLISVDHRWGIAHNGRVQDPAAVMERYGITLATTNDSETLLHLLQMGMPTEEALRIATADHAVPAALLVGCRWGVLAMAAGHPIYARPVPAGTVLCSRANGTGAARLPDGVERRYELAGKVGVPK